LSIRLENAAPATYLTGVTAKAKIVSHDLTLPSLSDPTGATGEVRPASARVPHRDKERDMADRPDDPTHTKRSARRPKQPDPRARFAQAIARAELGRAYWGEDSEADFREAKKRKPPKTKTGKG